VSKAKTSTLMVAAAVLALAGMLMAASAAYAAFVKAAQWEIELETGALIDSVGDNEPSYLQDITQDYSDFIFNGVSSYVRIPDINDALDPSAANIRLKAAVKVTDKPMDDDSYDVVRKGLAGRPGGDYKMEIKATSNPDVGKLHCVFSGNKGTVRRFAGPDIVDGEWHKLACIKKRNSVVAQVDGRSYTKSARAGSISNESNIMLGAKTESPLDDVFDGSMNYVRIDIAE
jgi:hypothetical protein